MTTVAPYIAPMGSPDIATAGYLTEMSVSRPTPSSYAVDSGGGSGNMYWKFTAAQSGFLSFDALLSEYMDDSFNTDPVGPDVGLTLLALDGTILAVGDSYDGLSVGFPQPRYQDRFTYEVTAGVTYVLRAHVYYKDYPWIQVVVRIGDYPAIPSWVQPSDLQYVIGRTTGNIHASAPTGVGSINFGGGGSSSGVGFHGILFIDRAFGGPIPGDVPAARDCCWNWARRLWNNNHYWWNSTPDGSGTHYDGGVCVVLPNVIYPSSISGSPTNSSTGYSYDTLGGTGGLDNNWVVFRTFATSQIVAPSGCPNLNTPSGTGLGTPSYVGTLPHGATLEWEDANSELLTVEVAPDESAAPSGNGAAVATKWYIGDDADVPAGTWGPNATGWNGTLAGPESFVGYVDHIGDYSGGLSGWTVVAESLWKDAGAPTYFRLTAIPDGLFSSSPPGALGTLAHGVTATAFRNSQYCAVRYTLRPSRYRIILEPAIPDITWDGTSAIALDQEADGAVFY